MVNLTSTRGFRVGAALTVLLALGLAAMALNSGAAPAGSITGFEICTVASHCQRGSQGALGGEGKEFYDVAADADGNVYVTDGNSRIQKFRSSGTYFEPGARSDPRREHGVRGLHRGLRLQGW